ncbi:MAG: hypothetical protein QF596_06440 [Acidimicrobiales bacterium]|jgi:hypothetical protein|nr:hypothetical protein [Acidimicrobiales bacterium]MDP6298879.1 hypothetical protein [Acidimicrobiales bacterium]HJM27788.1 hypothetical protein [Acidimicrobiales bacterium]HJM98071.1 hypothetical protein [Acidimicrobiales bacterium]
MKLRFSLIVLGLLLLTACGSSGKPKSFFEQPGPLPEKIYEFGDQLLVNGEDLDLVPLVQRNFLEGCMIGGIQREPSISPISLASACACSYDDLVAYVREVSATEEAAFKLFEDLDKSLQKEGGYASLGSDYKEIFASCQS